MKSGGLAADSLHYLGGEIMENKWIGCEKVINGVEVHWFNGDPYVCLDKYKKLLKELEDLKRKEE